MERTDIIPILTEIFRNVLKNPSLILGEESQPKDVERWDSLHHIQLIVSIEKCFKVKIPIAEIEKWKNVGDIVDSLYLRLSAGTAGGRKRSVIKEPFFRDRQQRMPLVIRPADGLVNLADWIKESKEELEADLVYHGAILFRGFPVGTVADFDAFMKCFSTEPLPYMFRSSPRDELDGKIKNIFKSTSYPADRTINMHNESSYSRAWGMKIAFCCIQPPAEGGETPLADSRRVFKDIAPELLEKFRAKGVRYRRNLFRGLGMPWTEVFQTDDVEVVKQICERNDIGFEFKGGDLTIEWSKPAIYHHPVSGEGTWFNHVFFFHRFSRYEELEYDPADDIPQEYLSSEVFFGDGSDISYEEYSDIRRAFRKNMIAIPYEKGDVFLLDNMLTAHGRNPYRGERTIATAIVEPAYDSSYAL